jgi:prepilin-type N-terminal cleavage/methylation domain-containing protein
VATPERRAAFTLVEILLVVAIILIISSLTIPMFARSYQASNLRSAARMVATAAKYARNMAVLQQKQMSLFFDTETGELKIVAVERAGGVNLDAFMEGQRAERAEEEQFAADVRRTQQLPERVQIVDFSAPSEMQQMDSVFWVNYFPSGVSDSFSVRISDENRRGSVYIEVDHLSGTTTTTYE